MSKKSARRKMRREIPQSRAGTAAPGRSSPASTAASPAQTASSKTFEFQPDYSYVIKDLRRIGTLAGAFIAILLILSFFLR